MTINRKHLIIAIATFITLVIASILLLPKAISKDEGATVSTKKQEQAKERITGDYSGGSSTSTPKATSAKPQAPKDTKIATLPKATESTIKPPVKIAKDNLPKPLPPKPVKQNNKGNTLPPAPQKLSFSKLTVTIPALKIVKSINPSFGDVKNGELTLPTDTSFVRYKYGAQLNDSTGSILLASHITYKKEMGPLLKANTLKKGSVAYVTDANGKTRKWELYKTTLFDKNRLSEHTDIFNPNGVNRLVMITCGGEVTTTSSGARQYSDNFLLEFKPVK